MTNFLKFLPVVSYAAAGAAHGKGGADNGGQADIVQRVNGQRVVHVTADIDRGVATPERVISEISRTTLPEIAKRYDVDWGLAGEQEERAKAMLGLAVAAVMALFIIYALLAVPLRSYLQPLVIMSVIPFGAVGAITGS